jgi:Cu/Ag efflux pump CusA
LRWIVRSSLRFRFLVVAAAAAMVLFGVQELRDEKLDVFPEFAPTQVQVQTEALGLSASEVEQLVTVPLENALNGAPGVSDIRSESVPQLSAITLLFKSGTDLLQARRWVEERLQAVSPTLPTWAASPVMMPPVSATSRIMAVGIRSRSLSPRDLSMLAFWTIRARLLRVPGVANVAIWGERPKQLQVRAEPRRLQAQGISLHRLMDAASGAVENGLLRFVPGSVVGTGGFVDTPRRRLPVRTVLPIARPSQLAEVPIDGTGDRRLRIGDVARVAYGTSPLIGDAVVGGGPGLLMVVEKFPGANTLDVTRGVDRAVDDLQPGLPGVRIDTHIFRPATFIQTAIDNLTIAVLIGCVLVVFVLVAFLYQWRAALISLVTIPLSLVAAALVLDARGATVNTMMLAGFAVAVGVVVDDAIIDTENIVRRLRGRLGTPGWAAGERRSAAGKDAAGAAYLESTQAGEDAAWRAPAPPDVREGVSRRPLTRRAAGKPVSVAGVILAASLEVRGAILYATVINVAAVVPVLFIGGVSGAFFRPLALSYALAVLASMLVALTVTPALALILLAGRPPRREPPLARLLKRAYEAALRRVIATPWPAYAAVGAAALAAALVAPRLGEDLFPTFKEQDFLMHWITRPGTSVKEERRVVTRASHQVRRIPGVRDFGSHIGQAFLGEEIAGPNFGENWVSVDPHADFDRTVAGIREVEDSTPGLYRDVETYLRERIDEVLAGSSEAIVVRIFGPNLTVLRREAHRVRSALAGVEGLVDLHAEASQNVPQIKVRVRLAAARRYGLKPGDVRRAEATMVASEDVGRIFRGGRVYEVAVESVPRDRRNLADLRRLPIDTPGGGQVPLGRVASVRIAPTPNDIKRENDSRRIDVDANVSGRDLGSVTADVKRRLASVDFPLGYRAELLGEAAERQAAEHRLLLFAAGAAIAILLLLQAAFARWGLAVMLFATLPMALVGGVLAAYGAIGVISLGALIGFYAVLGIAARNGIMMITHLQHLERYEGERFGTALVLRGARERLTPILMTASATGLALLPLVVLGSRPGQEIEHPMAVVILGGLVTSTLLNLFVVPALYLRFGRPARGPGS